MNYDEYAALPGVRASRLKLMALSPLHYQEKEDKPTTNRGMLRAVHSLALEPHRFDEDFAVWEGVRRGKAFEAFEAEQGNRTILNEKEHGQAQAIVEGMKRHPWAGKILAMNGRTEETITWTSPGTGLLCKARLDKRVGKLVVDLKTYGTSDPRVIGRRVAQLGAHIQAAHYVEGVSIALGIPEKEVRYVLICAESASPFDVAVVELSQEDALALGRAERDRLMARIVECEASGKWPGACPDLVALDLPAWADPLMDGGDAVSPSEEA